MSDNKQTQAHNTDPEKGVDANHTPNNVGKVARVINVTESSATRNNTNAAAATKWGKFLAGAASTNAAPSAASNNATALAAAAKDTNVVANNKAGPTTPAPKPAPKPLSKWGKLLANKQEPIQEATEEEEENGSRPKLGIKLSNLRKPPADTDSLSVQGNTGDPTKLEVGGVDEAPPLTQRDINLALAPAPAALGGLGGTALSPAEQHLITSLYDIKLEIKEEIESLHHKMSRIDMQIGDILKLFTPHSTPDHSSHTPSSTSSQMHSSTESGSCNSSVGSSSIVTSPKSSVPSSPHRVPPSLGAPSSRDHLSVAHIPMAMAADPLRSAMGLPPPPRKGSPCSSKGSSSSGSPTPPHILGRASSSIDSHSGSMSGSASGSSPASSSGSSSSRRSSKRKKTSSSRKRVAPIPSDIDEALGGVVLARDDDTTHIKDRDLDIL